MEVIFALVTSFSIYGLNAYVTPMPSMDACRSILPAIEKSVTSNPDNITSKVECITVALPEPPAAP
jgi:hypothetical protein